MLSNADAGIEFSKETKVNITMLPSFTIILDTYTAKISIPYNYLDCVPVENFENQFYLGNCNAACMCMKLFKFYLKYFYMLWFIYSQR